MAQVLIVYFSHGGNTRKAAEALAQTIRKNDCEVVLKGVEETDLDDLRQADGILLGSPFILAIWPLP